MNNSAFVSCEHQVKLRYAVDVISLNINAHQHVAFQIRGMRGLSGNISFDQYGVRSNYTVDIVEVTVNSELTTVSASLQITQIYIEAYLKVDAAGKCV